MMGQANVAAREVAQDLLFREADALDRQDWQGWLALYAEDARFWAPAWLDEHRPTSDPETEVSLIYHTSRRELAERVSRVGSRKSVTALPLPRTMHLLGNILVETSAADRMTVRANAQVTSFDPRMATTHVSALRYEYQLRRDDGGDWRIAAKTIWLVNDRMPSVLDFYSL